MRENQQSYIVQEKNINIYFWVFVILHVLIWTLGPALVRPNLTHDTLEGIAWGLQWQWGYNKHPFLSAWLCAGITQVFGSLEWPVYFLAQVVVATTFWAVWKLARLQLPSLHALIAALVLEGVLFYNLNSFNLTPDTVQSPLWALFALFSYQALTQKKNSNWFFVALFAALGVMTKYQMFLLIISTLMFCLINPIARQNFKKPGIYSAMLVFFILIAPHIIWLVQHDFVNLTYAMTSSVKNPTSNNLLNHLIYPVRFFISSVSNVFGVFVLIWPFYSSSSFREQSLEQGKWNRCSKSFTSNSERFYPRRLCTSRLFVGNDMPPACQEESHFNWQFLCFLGFGPLLLTLILGIANGNEYPSRWSTPYYFLIGIMMMLYLKPVLTRSRLKQFVRTLVLFSLGLFILRMGSFLIHPRANSDQFLPNKMIAQTITKLWSERYNTPLSFIAGTHYLVALTTPYIPGAPKPYFDWSPQESPWINENELRKKGGIFIWDEGRNYTWDADSIRYASIPDDVWQRFPLLNRLPVYTFHRLSKGKEPVVVGIAILPPKKEKREEEKLFKRIHHVE